jgi:uncharacterized protein YktA (UPF0223 family)
LIPLALNWYTEEAVSVFPFVRCDESMDVKKEFSVLFMILYLEDF